MKLWLKSETPDINKLVEDYTVGDDHIVDMHIIKYDIQASLAHAAGLVKLGIFTQDEYNTIENAMKELESLIDSGKFSIAKEDEDCHTAIENFLTKKIGTPGKKIQTGRSRNDQVLVALRLYMKDNAASIISLSKKLKEKFLALANKYKEFPFPGYSHTQQGMISSLGHYFASFYESISDDIEFFSSSVEYIDKNPLGSAAGFGVNLPLERELTTKLLGFSRVQVNSLYCQNSRGKFESAYMEGLNQIMLTLGKLAEDMVLFTSREFAFFTVDSTFTTGSSIMPQKKNLDVMELLRANVSIIISEQLNVKMISKSLPSGYNRDFQLMKRSLINTVNVVIQSLNVTVAFLDAIEPDKESILSKIKKDIIAADLATEKVKEGIPFRDAYKIVMEEVDNSPINWEQEIKRRQSLGSAGNLGLPIST